MSYDHRVDDVLQRAAAGDRSAFDEVVAPHLPKLRAVIRRLVGHPEDTADLTQDVLLAAFQKLSAFRGDAKLSTWLCSIGTRAALDYLRGRKRWRREAQLLSEHEAHATAAKRGEVAQLYDAPDFIFDVHEHIAFCFTCVARTLEPEKHAALLLRDVFQLSNEESASVLGLSESTLRHRLSHAPLDHARALR